MNERFIQLRGQADQRRELVRSLAGSRECLADWLKTRGADVALLREKVEAPSVSVGVSLSDDRLYENLTVRENLELFSRLSGVTPSSTLPLLDLFGLKKLGNTYFGKLSGDLRLRLQLAVSLVTAPEVVIWEEPEFGDNEFVSRLFDWLEENESRVIFSSEESLDGAACKIVEPKGEH